MEVNLKPIKRKIQVGDIIKTYDGIFCWVVENNNSTMDRVSNEIVPLESIYLFVNIETGIRHSSWTSLKQAESTCIVVIPHGKGIITWAEEE